MTSTFGVRIASRIGSARERQRRPPRRPAWSEGAALASRSPWFRTRGRPHGRHLPLPFEFLDGLDFFCASFTAFNAASACLTAASACA